MMIPLSRRAQRWAARRFAQLSFINAFSWILVIEMPIILLALHYGASDLQMGFLYSAPLVTGVGSLFAPRLFRGMDMVLVHALAWWLRAALALGYLLVAWGIPEGSGAKAWGVILVLYLVCFARSLGMSVNSAVTKALAPPRELPGLIARVVGAMMWGALLCRILAYLWTRRAPLEPEPALLVLVCIGILANGATAYLYTTLPRIGPISGEGLLRLARSLGGLLREAPVRRVLRLTLLQTPSLIFLGYTNSFVKNVAGFSDDQVFLLTVFGVLASIAAMQLYRMIGHRIGAGTFVFGANAVLAFLAAVWAMHRALPWPPRPELFYLLYPLGLVGQATLGTVLLRLHTGAMPRDRASQAAILYQVVVMIASLLTLGGIRLGEGLDLGATIPYAHAYTPLFLVWSALCVVLAVVGLTLPREGRRTVIGDLSLLLPQNLLEMARLHRVEAEPEKPARRWRLEGVMLGASPLREDVVRESFGTCDLSRRYAALRTLAIEPLQGGLPEVAEEAFSPDSPLRMEALTALGFLEDRSVVPRLEALLEPDTEPRLSACAAKSLLRLGVDLEAERVAALYARCDSTHARLQILVGLAHVRRREELFAFLGREFAASPSACWRDTVLQVVAEPMGLRGEMVETLDELRADPVTAWETFLADWTGAEGESLPRETIEARIAEKAFSALGEDLRRAGRHDPYLRAFFEAGGTLRDAGAAAGMLLLYQHLARL